VIGRITTKDGNTIECYIPTMNLIESVNYKLSISNNGGIDYSIALMQLNTTLSEFIIQ
jgi:hypothetical protein